MASRLLLVVGMVVVQATRLQQQVTHCKGANERGEADRFDCLSM